MKKLVQKGFTLIELVIVIIIIGILAAAGVAIFQDTASSAVTASKEAFSSNVKSALAIYIAENKAAPTVTQLATLVQGGTAAAGGVTATINGSTVTVPTYVAGAATCTTATTAVGDTVECVGDAS